MPHLISIIYRIFGFDIKVTVLKAKILKPNLFEGILDIETKSKTIVSLLPSALQIHQI